jgi:hypothetical protein
MSAREGTALLGGLLAGLVARRDLLVSLTVSAVAQERERDITW